MWMSLVLLGFLVLAAVAGITGRGVYDSRDTAYSLRLPEAVPPPADAQLPVVDPEDA